MISHGCKSVTKIGYPAFIEPTCTYCMVGSYALLSVRPSIRLSLDNNSYLGKYHSYEFEILPEAINFKRPNWKDKYMALLNTCS